MKAEKEKRQHEQDAHRPLMDNKAQKEHRSCVNCKHGSIPDYRDVICWSCGDRDNWEQCD